eukprot:3188724-Alexandrium_andersonii.AAC.1
MTVAGEAHADSRPQARGRRPCRRRPPRSPWTNRQCLTGRSAVLASAQAHGCGGTKQVALAAG